MRTAALLVLLGSACAQGGGGECTTGADCPAGLRCSDGVCVDPSLLDSSVAGDSAPVVCVPPMADCDGNPATGCETDLSAPTSCGACANVCDAPANGTPTCVEMMCAFDCAPGLVPCDDVCSATCNGQELREPMMTSLLVPDSCEAIDFRAWGAGGGNGTGNSRAAAGGYARGIVPVTPGETLLLVVGAPGTDAPGGSSGAGGLPGGGRGGTGSDSQGGGGGGGYTGVFRGEITQAGALIIAGGGAGSGGDGSPRAGAGGGADGEAAAGGGAGGGTQTMGGAAGGGRGVPTAGTALQGGAGGDQGSGDGGGGGGGGYFGGGGGGGANSDANPGGGGSGFVITEATMVVLEAGAGATTAAASDPERMNAGDPRSPGALILGCVNPVL